MVKKVSIPVNQVIEDIREFSSLLDTEQLSQLRSSLTLRQYKRNAVIYDDGDVPQYMFCLIRGKAKITRQGIGMRPQIVRALRPVEFFGYRAYFARENYRTNGMSLEASVVCLIPMALIEQWMQTNIAVSNFFVHQLSIFLGDSDQRVVTLTQKHLRGRLADSILFLYDRYGLDPETGFLSAALSREDLASLSNMTTSNAIRTLHNFAVEGILEIDGRKLHILKLDELKVISAAGE